jgi:hypothetical protein
MAQSLGECLLWEAPVTGADARRQDVPCVLSQFPVAAGTSLGGPAGGGAVLRSPGDSDTRLVTWRTNGQAMELQETTLATTHTIATQEAHSPSTGCCLTFASPLLGGPLHCALPHGLLLLCFCQDGGAHSVQLVAEPGPTVLAAARTRVHSVDLGPTLHRLGRCVSAVAHSARTHLDAGRAWASGCREGSTFARRFAGPTACPN